MLISRNLLCTLLTALVYRAHRQLEHIRHQFHSVSLSYGRLVASEGHASSHEVEAMTEYAPGSGRDRNTFYSNPHLVSPHYTNGNGVNYFYPQGQLQLPTTGTYTTCTPMYASSPQSSPQSSMYMSNNNPAGVTYSLAPPPRAYPTQPRTPSYPPYHTGVVPTQRGAISHQLRRAYPPDLALAHVNEIESQESINEDTMLSEPILPALEGYPDVGEFDQLMDTWECIFISSSRKLTMTDTSKDYPRRSKTKH